jgi:hypothetical protein
MGREGIITTGLGCGTGCCGEKTFVVKNEAAKTNMPISVSYIG